MSRNEVEWSSLDLYKTEGCIVRELTIKPGKVMPYQRHLHRCEVWYVRKGTGKARRGLHGNAPYVYVDFRLNEGDIHTIYKDHWHKIWNESTEDLIIIETQYGLRIDDSDVEYIMDESELVEIRKKMYGNKYAEST